MTPRYTVQVMIKNQSYFALPDCCNPGKWLDRKLNPYHHSADADLHGHPLAIHLTRRAARELSQLTRPLLVEMQLYFSCVVKKRVLIHAADHAESYQSAYHNLSVKFRCVEADSCSPEEFASHYPGKKQMTAPAITKMHARKLFLDYKKNEWLALFDI